MKNTSPQLLPIFIRTEVIRAVRAFFEQKNFAEVLVPTFNHSVPLEPTNYPFVTEWQISQPPQQLFLTTSPEKGIKKMLGMGIGNCFAIGKCFRNLEGSGSRHNPEFLMLEWYREDATYQQIIQDTQELIQFTKKRVDAFLQVKSNSSLAYQGKKYNLNGEWPVLSLEEMFFRYTGLRLKEVIEDQALMAAAQKKGYQVSGANWEQIFNQMMLNEVELHFPMTPFFLIDFPARISPLCQVNSDKSYLAERFEFFIGGMEIANGNNENTNTQMVRNFFTKEHEHRQRTNQVTQPIDEEFLTSLQQMHDSGKKFAGIGLGLERLSMIMADASDIKQVEPFCV